MPSDTERPVVSYADSFVRLGALVLVALLFIALGGVLVSGFGGGSSLLTEWAASILVAFITLLALSIAWFVLILSDIFRWIRCSDSTIGSVLSPVLMLCVMLMITTALGSVASKLLASNSDDVNTPPIVLLGQDVYYDTVLLPAFENEGRVHSQQRTNRCELPGEGGFAQGAEFSQRVQPMIDYLAPALLACTGENTVRVRVRGYASSSEFRRCTENSDALNLLLANKRAEVAAQELQNAIVRAGRGMQPPAKVEVIPWVWGSVGDMHANRLFSDRGMATTSASGAQARVYSSFRGRLTRRAEIQFIEKGDCEARKFAEEQGLPQKLTEAARIGFEGTANE